jgi:hypothetical protein
MALLVCGKGRVSFVETFVNVSAFILPEPIHLSVHHKM